MQTKKFQKTKEDFVCERCGTIMQGNGYTNHCSRCLWSKHIDIHPGDRQESCGGLMEPIEVVYRHSEYIITHQCTVCGFKRSNSASRDDDFDMLVEISHTNKQK